jgi:UDPglucose--hexose-1-phosphate uridylyltransferase
MLEHRQDPLTGRWVSIAAARGERPDDFGMVEPRERPGPCPFCEGHEQETPHELLAVRPAASGVDTPGWQVRVIANKYPAFTADAKASPGDEFYRCDPAAGLHEVIVESPQHLTRVSQLNHDQLATVVRVYCERLRTIGATGRWRYALLFKNSGAAAGASLAHVHSQLIALAHVPAAVANKVARAQAYFAQHRRTIWQAMIEREQADGRRIVTANEHFLAICPYASAAPYELLVLPRRGVCHFAQVSDEEIFALAALLRDLSLRLESKVPAVAYNWLIHTSPFDSTGGEHYHWHVEIVPRLTRTAGYEWATGNAINPVPPEKAAAELRSGGF